MKTKLIFALCCVFAAAAAQAAYKDGTYRGVGQGNASQIEVAVTVASGKITKIDVLKQGETEMLFNAASKHVIPAAVKANGVEGVEAVTGASNSSKGLISAISDALSKASK